MRREKSCCKYDFKNHDLCSPSEHCDCNFGCELRGQCCRDYRDYCFSYEKVDDCKYGPWSEWSSCSTKERCDVGYRTRTRDVQQIGNFKSNIRCNKDDMVQYQQCGELSCYRYSMQSPTNKLEFWDTLRGNYSSAIFKFLKPVHGKCDTFLPSITTACIACAHDDRCGQYTIRPNDEIQIIYQGCNGLWQKTSRSYYRDYGAECNRHWYYMDTFNFV